MKRTGQIPFFAGAAVCLLIRAMPLKGLSSPGVWCLGLTLMTVIWWAAQVAQPGGTAGAHRLNLLHHRIPFATGSAAALPFGIDRAALLADKNLFALHAHKLCLTSFQIVICLIYSLYPRLSPFFHPPDYLLALAYYPKPQRLPHPPRQPQPAPNPPAAPCQNTPDHPPPRPK